MTRHDGEALVNSMDSAVRVMAAHQTPVTAWVAEEPDEAAPRLADQPTTAPAVFTTDRGAPGDDLGRSGEAAFLAELALHKQAQTPFAIGLFGAAGAGKSAFLGQLLAAAERLAGAASTAGPTSPFTADLVVVPIDAASGGEAGAVLRDAVLARIADTHPALAAELRHAGADPAEASRKADQALDDARRRLDVERETLDGLTGREARLVEAVVDAPGSHVDAYARSKRSRIERVQRQFGFGGADPIATYKVLVREAAESNGTLDRVGLTLRALWAYKGQTRLIVTAVMLFVAVYAIDLVRSSAAEWLDSIRASSDRGAAAADWLQEHLHWLAPLQTVLMLLGVFLLLINVLRAARFVLPLARGVDLLHQDLEGRRRDLASQLAHQTRRVDALATEVEAAARQASEAERRTSAPVPTASRERRAGLQRPQRDDAAAVFRALSAAMASAPGAPRRLVMAIDGLDQRSDEAAAALVSTASRLLGEGCVCVVAAQQSQLLAGFGDTDPARATAQFHRCIQLPYRVGPAGASDVAWRAYAVTLLDSDDARAAAGSTGDVAPPDPLSSALDAPWRPREAETVAALAPIAGETPRAIKHYVNLYRVARADPRLRDAEPPVFTALALALALDAHGLTEDLSALDRVSRGEEPDSWATLRKAWAVARDASHSPVELGQAQRALDVARSYTGRIER